MTSPSQPTGPNAPPPLSPQGGGVGTQKTQVVKLDDLVKKEFPRKSSIKERATFLQKTGKTLFAWVLVSTLVVIAASFAFLYQQTPRLDSRAVSTGSAVVATVDTIAVRVVAEQRAAAFDRFIRTIERLVIAVFLPLLTAILGYLFGTREEAKPADEEETES